MGKHHARIINSLPGVALVAISDINFASANELAKLYQAQAFSDYKQMFDLVEAVSIVTPTATHYTIAKDCLENKKHCLVEKPLTKTSVESEQLANLAKDNACQLAVGFIERFNPAYVELKKLLRKEKILGLEFKRYSPFPERISDANVIEDMMIHDLDLVQDLLKTDTLESIKAEGKKIHSKALDQVSALLYFESGIIAKLSADRTFNDRVRKIFATTDKGLIEADLLNKSIYFRDFMHPIPSVHFTKPKDQLTEELQDFIKSIKSGVSPKCSGLDAYKANKLAEEVQNLC
jgi:virulence factor